MASTYVTEHTNTTGRQYHLDSVEVLHIKDSQGTSEAIEFHKDD